MKQNIWFVYWIASTYSVTNVNSICKHAKCGYCIFNCFWITITYKGKLITKIVGKNVKWLNGNNQKSYSFYRNCLLNITYCSLHWIYIYLYGSYMDRNKTRKIFISFFSHNILLVLIDVFQFSFVWQHFVWCVKPVCSYFHVFCCCSCCQMYFSMRTHSV